MAAFTEVVATDPLSRTACNYQITYTLTWKDFYETTLPVTETNFVTFDTVDFRYLVRSD